MAPLTVPSIRRNWLEVNLDNLVHNYWLLSQLAHNSLMPVIKANAYAHGAKEVAKKLITETNVDRFAVADVSEALEIRQSLDLAKKVELISLSPVIDQENINLCLNHQIIPTIPSLVAFDQLIKILAKSKQKNIKYPMPIWLKINTGMNRLGIKPKIAKKLIEKSLVDYAHLIEIRVLITHLSSAEEEPAIFTNDQIDQFNRLITSLKKPFITSIGNSAFLLNPKIKHFDHITRSGLALYGVDPFYFEKVSDEVNQICKQLKPSSSLKAKIIALDDLKKGEYVGYSRNWQANQKTKMATVSIGYADGYPRHIPNGTKVLVNHQLASIIGRISMDTCSINLNGIKAKLGDVVTFFGDGLDVNEIAKAAQTIPYEILTRARPRGGIVYVN